MSTKTAENGSNTRERLLQAAGEVFSEQGFARATVREICRRAAVQNLAAIGYHFGDKEQLYREVLRVAHCAAQGHAFLDHGLPTGATPEERLEKFVHELIFHCFEGTRQSWQDQLILREWSDPTEPMANLVEDYMRPRYELLLGLVREIVGPAVAEITVKRCVNSLVSQCVHYHQARFIFSRLTPEQSLDEAGLKELAAHIAAFSLAGMKALSKVAPKERGNE
jgi:TetR/AcrR family transcriptional regulator, regulator of cefoperazone and chloramphenicol sensitivity